MVNEYDVVGRFSGLHLKTLKIWIKRGWVTPTTDPDGYHFQEIDVARVGLIYDFSNDLQLDDDTVDVLLPLLDQVHGLRNQLRRLAQAVDAQPEEVRRRIAQTLADGGEEV